MTAKHPKATSPAAIASARKKSPAPKGFVPFAKKSAGGTAKGKK